jgi:hypothetical protein
MADKNLTVGIDIKANSAEAKAAAAAMTSVANAAKQATVTANGASQASKELGKSSSNSAMGVLALSNAFQDAQYGMAGIVNNIPMMVSGLGLGMGVAGVAQAAAVGIQILTKNFDIFGTKAKEASEAANKEAAELMDLANKAYLAEKAALALADAQQKQADSAQQINGHYQEQIRLSNEIIAQKKAQADAEIASADAEAAVAMARLQLMEATGQVTKENAMIQRGQIQMQSDARKQAASESAELAKMIELRKQANAEEAKGNALRLKAKEIAEKGGGLLSEAGLKDTEAGVASIEQQMEASRLAQAEIAKKLSDNRLLKSGMLGPGGVILNEVMIGTDKATNERKLREEAAKYAEMQVALDREKAKITAHKNAVDETGIKTQDELNKLVESQVDEARKSASAASQFRGQANTVEGGVVRGRGIFGLRQEAAAISTMAGVEGERAKAREENAKAEAKRKKEQESDLMAAQRGALKIARGLGNDISESGIDALKRAALGIEGGGQSQIKELARLLALLAKRQTKQDAEVESLLTKVNDMIVAK